jgi:hypothetical protein
VCECREDLIRRGTQVWERILFFATRRDISYNKIICESKWVGDSCIVSVDWLDEFVARVEETEVDSLDSDVRIDICS